MGALFSELPDARRPPRSTLTPCAWRPLAAPPPSTWLEGVKRLAVDVERRDETLRALGPGTFRGAYVCGLAVGTDDGRRWYLPVKHEGGGNCSWDVKRWFVESLRGYRGEVIGAKLLYDLEALTHEWGCDFSNVAGFHDVITAEAVLDEWRLRYSLDSIALDRLGVGKAQGRLDELARVNRWRTDGEVKANLWRLPGHEVGEYGEGDVDLPLRLLPLQLRALEADGQLEVYDLERRLLPVLLDMRLVGVRVASSSRVEEVRARLVRERDRWDAEVKRLLGARASYASSDTLGQPLADRGLAVPRTAPSKSSPLGRWSVTKEFLERGKGDAAVNAVASARRVATLISLTIDSIVDHVTADGRVHFEVNPLKGEDENGKLRGTIARCSCSHPNTQQIPTRQSEFDELLFDGDFDVTRELRGLYLPNEGESWESADFSQIEYRLLVNCAVDPRGGAPAGRRAEDARERYRNDPRTDYHKFVAELMRVDPEDQKRRKRIKNLNFAYGYGAGDEKLAVTFNCSPSEATVFRKEYEVQCPFVRATYKRCDEWAQRRGFVETVLGRKARFPLWEPAGQYGSSKRPAFPLERATREYPSARLVRAGTYKALNRKMQGSGADVMKLAMVVAHEAGLTRELGGAFLLTVHDELDVSVAPTRAARSAADELVRIMETCVPLSVPLTVKVEAGPSWGDVK